MSKVKHPKMDPYLIAADQPYEIEYVQKKMKKEGIIVTASQIRSDSKKLHHSRRSVYKFLRAQYKNQ